MKHLLLSFILLVPSTHAADSVEPARFQIVEVKILGSEFPQTLKIDTKTGKTWCLIKAHPEDVKRGIIFTWEEIPENNLIAADLSAGALIPHELYNAPKEKSAPVLPR